jgi:hypothetical protein
MMATNDVHPKWLEEKLSPKDQDNLKRAEHLWNEFQYRHDLIWNLVFRLTIAVVLLGIIPYTQSDLIKMLGSVFSWGILIPPFLGAVLAWIGFRRIRSELNQLAYIWRLYRPLQDNLFVPFDPDTKFPTDIKIYTLILTVVAVVNILLAGIFRSCILKIPLSWCASLGF